MSQETARDNWEEGEDDAKSAWPFDDLGRTRGTMVGTMRFDAARRRLIAPKPISVRIEV